MRVLLREPTARWRGIDRTVTRPAYFPSFTYENAPVNVYWEMTVACDLACRHCRADALAQRDPLELSTEEGKQLMRDVQAMGSHLILTGGDPLKRADVFELIDYGRSIHLPLAITPAVTPLLTRDIIDRFKEVGVHTIGMSLDGPTAELHDGFRQVPGTFEMSMNALRWCREAGMGVQINSTVTRDTIKHVPAMFEVLKQNAPPVRRWSLFNLIPVGRGLMLGSPSAQQIEDLFQWVYDETKGAPFHVSTVEAPHYRRYWMQRKLAEGVPLAEIEQRGRMMGFGIRDGSGIVFVSHRGEVYPAGFLPSPLLGIVRERPIHEIYRTAPGVLKLREMDRLEGRCGACEYRWVCGGSRARAYAATGNTMASDPLCVYQPETAAAE
jgi:radical SAM protein